MTWTPAMLQRREKGVDTEPDLFFFGPLHHANNNKMRTECKWTKVLYGGDLVNFLLDATDQFASSIE